jgi:hypothetical protein
MQWISRLAEWLEGIRSFFVPYDEFLSNELLTYDDGVDPTKWEDALREKINMPPPAGYRTEGLVYSFRDRQQDPNVNFVPSPIFLAETVGDIEWFYILDLDHRLLQVIGGKTPVKRFPLDKVPRGRAFVYSLLHGDEDAMADNKPGAAVSVPAEAASSGCSAPHQEFLVPIIDAEPLTLRLYRVTTLDEPLRPQPFPNANCVIRKLLFLKLVAKYASFLANFVAGFTPDDFIYREFAFAILSLAAGEFSLLNTVELPENRSLGGSISDNNTLFKAGAFSYSDVNILSAYRPLDNAVVISDVDDRQDPRFSQLARHRRDTTSSAYESTHDFRTNYCIPCFGQGAHKRHVVAGSAPANGTTFWLSNVVIHLLSDHTNSPPSCFDSHQLDAAVMEIVKFAWPHGLAHQTCRAFYSIIFSLARVVLLRIEPAAGTPTAPGGADATVAIVRHTDPMPLLALQPLGLGYRSENSHADATFAAMARLFGAACDLTHTCTAANAGALPDEILHRVVDCADWNTRRNLARASATCAAYVRGRVHLSVLGPEGSVARLRPVTLVGERNEMLPGYAVVDDAASGGGGFLAADTPGKGKGKRTYASVEDSERAWFLRRKESVSCRGWCPAAGKSPRAIFLPVIGDGDRCSVLADVSYTLFQVAKRCLMVRDEDSDARKGVPKYC